MTKKFLRRDWKRHSKLGKGRKKKQKWRSPKGRDNKMREKRKGYPSIVSIGYKKPKREKKILINSLQDIENLSLSHEKARFVLRKMGKKKKIEIAKKIKKKKITLENLNADKFLKKIEKETGKKEKEKANEEEKKNEKNVDKGGKA